MAHRHHEVRTGKDGDLAGLHLIGVIDVPEGLQDQEQRLVVQLQLRPLMSVCRVLHGQGMQREDLGDQIQFCPAGAVQSYPHEVVVASTVAGGAQILQIRLQRDAGTLPVQSYVDDHDDHRSAEDAQILDPGQILLLPRLAAPGPAGQGACGQDTPSRLGPWQR